MTIRVLVNGSNGKMGSLVVKTLAADPHFTLAGTTGHHDNLEAEIKKSGANVVVDFTNASVALKNTETIIAAGAHPVIGTSGLLKEQIDRLKEHCAQRKLGGIIAPNFSVGMVLMMKYATEMAKHFSEVEIIEMHHSGKLDAPSGTAIRTAEMLATNRTIKPQSLKQHETIPGSRGAECDNIPIHAIRLPGLIANQQIIFGGVGETLILRHDTTDRMCFMPGVILACKKVLELNQLVYGLEHLL